MGDCGPKNGQRPHITVYTATCMQLKQWVNIWQACIRTLVVWYKYKTARSSSVQLLCRMYITLQSRNLGPGTYKVEALLGDFDQKQVEERASGPGWKKAYESAQLSAIPHLLYKEQWEQKHLIQERRGPGMYQAQDFVDELNSKPASKLGVCSTRETRFKAESQVSQTIQRNVASGCTVCSQWMYCTYIASGHTQNTCLYTSGQ